MSDIDCGNCDCGNCDCGDCKCGDCDCGDCDCGDCGDCTNCGDCDICNIGDCCKDCNCVVFHGCCGDGSGCHCCECNGCCSDEGGDDVGHHFASLWWLCFLGDSCDGCCKQRRRTQSPDVYVVNAAPVLTPSSIVTAQPQSYEEACENAVISQPMKSYNT